MPLTEESFKTCKPNQWYSDAVATTASHLQRLAQLDLKNLTANQENLDRYISYLNNCQWQWGGKWHYNEFPGAGNHNNMLSWSQHYFMAWYFSSQELWRRLGEIRLFYDYVQKCDYYEQEIMLRGDYVELITCQASGRRLNNVLTFKVYFRTFVFSKINLEKFRADIERLDFLSGSDWVRSK
jgi:hypothetical protein